MFQSIWVKERGLNVGINEVIILLSEVGKIYAGILVGRVRKATGGLNDDEQRGLGIWYVDYIFILKQIGEKFREKTRMYIWVL